MRVLFTRFPLESALGGAERQTLTLMEGLRERGHAVAFLGSCPVLLRESASRSLFHASLSIGPPPVTKWGAVNFLWRKGSMRHRLLAALEQFQNLDAVFLLSLSEKLLATDWLSRRGVRVFWVEHDSVGRWLTRNPWLPRLRRLSGRATTITVSELSKKIYTELGWDEKRIVAIPNGVKVPAASPRVVPSAHRSHPYPPAPSPTEEGLGIGEKTAHTRHVLHLGFVSRLSPEKGADVLIEAISDLPDTVLTIVGTGREEHRLRSLIRNTKNEERVDILPRVDDLPSFYASIDVLALPSRSHDPFGMVAAEAMMLGVPVIVTDLCGIASSLQDGADALIVPGNSPRALAEAISRMQDPEFRARIGAEGKRTAEEKFSVERMVQDYENLFSA